MIELRRLHRYFGRTQAVDDVSFEVPQGTVFGYIGPNGAGKTTSMRILATLDLPTYGDALVDGFSVVNDPDRVRRRLGFMPDYFGTYPNVDCYEYLDFFARAYGLIGRERERALRHTMSFTGLDVLADEADPRPVQGHEAAAVPGPRHDPRSQRAGAGRARGRPGSPRPHRTAGDDPPAGRRRQDRAGQFAHPDRTGRDVRPGGDHRTGPAAGDRGGRPTCRRPTRRKAK